MAARGKCLADEIDGVGVDEVVVSVVPGIAARLELIAGGEDHVVIFNTARRH